jgi:hypothetical protein
MRYLATGSGELRRRRCSPSSVVLKTLILYTIMITGAIWEKVVFGKYLFAPAFFWEDVFSMAVLALHTAYLAAWLTGWLDRAAAVACPGRLRHLRGQRRAVPAQAACARRQDEATGERPAKLWQGVTE